MIHSMFDCYDMTDSCLADLARLLQEQQKEPVNMVWVSYYWQQVASMSTLLSWMLTAGQMLQAVHVIHEEKIVHSDLKPANFVLVRGQLKLIDFGIANAIANDTTNIQRDHQVCTPWLNLGITLPNCLKIIDRHRQLHESRGHRTPRRYAQAKGRPTIRYLVPWLYSLSDGVRSPPIPASLQLSKDEGHSGSNIHH